jgi:hypothetical protein
MPENHELLKEIHRLTLDSNRQLHKMRRSAFWGRLISFIVYAALLIAPLWFYMQYLAPVVDQMFKTVSEIQGTGAQASAQFNALQEAWQKLESTFGRASSTPR